MIPSINGFSRIRAVFFLAAGFLAAGSLGGQEPGAGFRSLPGERGYIYPPPGWDILDNQDPAAVSFVEDEGRAVFQVMSFPGEQYGSSAAIRDEVFSALSLEAREEGVFSFNGREAVLADAAFIQDGRKQRGYFFFLDTEDKDFYLTALALEQSYSDVHGELLSFLDSFAPDRAALGLPGPVSQFYLPVDGDGSGDSSRVTPEGGCGASGVIGPEEGEASQVVIEREAGILVQYPEAPPEGAWSRYYQIIMREIFYRLEPLAEALKPSLEGLSPFEQAEVLLGWVQGFSYARERSIVSDLLSPLTAARKGRGDCDARALLLLALLRHRGIEGILMVSASLSHALAAGAVPGDGARFQGLLVMETTAPVAPGQINRDHADPSLWLGIDFPFLD